MMQPEPPPPGKQTEVVNGIALRNNLGVLGFVRTFASLLTGIAVGILGVEGWWGFLPHIATQLLCAPVMLVKGATSPTKYFYTWTNYLFFNVFSSVTLLTYVLFWMIFYNLAHIF